MRIFLDTNTLIFYLYDREELNADIEDSLYDYTNTLFTSTVCVQELIHLCQIGKIEQDGNSVLGDLEDAGVEIEQVTKKHLSVLASLPLYDDHRDPNDRLIIAQAISDKITLVSSDRKFVRYERHGLDFVYNER